ncbi:Peptidase family M54 [anaerobic digester metagenome]
MRVIIQCFILLTLISCETAVNKDRNRAATDLSSKEKNETVVSIPKRVVHILPLGDVPSEYIDLIKSSVYSFYGYDCMILSQAEPTEDILAASKTRLEASKILTKYKSGEQRLIITEKDLAFKNKDKGIDEYGIMGMGYYPGTTSVVSTFRLKRQHGTRGAPVSAALFTERLQKVTLHEIGHNLGLDHCTNHPECLMSSANGTMRQVDRQKIWLCDSCKKLVQMKNRNIH